MLGAFWTYECYIYSESYGTKEHSGNKILMLWVEIKPPGIFSSLRTQTGPWSDTFSYHRHIVIISSFCYHHIIIISLLFCHFVILSSSYSYSWDMSKSTNIEYDDIFKETEKQTETVEHFLVKIKVKKESRLWRLGGRGETSIKCIRAPHINTS